LYSGATTSRACRAIGWVRKAWLARRASSERRGCSARVAKVIASIEDALSPARPAIGPEGRSGSVESIFARRCAPPSRAGRGHQNPWTALPCRCNLVPQFMNQTRRQFQEL
jgi:hypothetical protein